MSAGGVPTTETGLQSYKEAGYNLAEFFNLSGEKLSGALAALESVGGVDAVISDKNCFTLGSGLEYSEHVIRKAVGAYSNYDCVIGYNVWDEIVPGTDNINYTKANDVIGFLNKYDPNSLKFINLLPSYGPYNWDEGTYESYVDGYINAVDPQVLAFDYYPYLMDHADSTSDWWRDLGLFRTKSLEYNLPFWYYYQGVAISNTDTKPTNEQIKYQMYVGLAYGAKQLSQWIAVGDGLNSDGTKTDLFEQTKARNTELMAVGNYLFDKTSVAIHHTGGYSTQSNDEKFYLDSLSNSSIFNYHWLTGGAPDDLIISVFEDGTTDTKYVLIVNENTESAVTGTVKLDNSMNISQFDKATGNEVTVGTAKSISINISAGGGEVYILR